MPCRHCGATTDLGGDLRDAMRAYVGDVRAAIRADLEARFVASFYAQNMLATRDVVAGVCGVAMALMGLFMAYVLSSVFGSGIWWGYAAALVGFWLLSVLAFARGWRTMFALPAPAALAALESAVCSACGGATAFPAGDAAQQCRHCSSTLLVPSHLARSLLYRVKGAAETSTGAREDALSTAVGTGAGYVKPAVGMIVVVVVMAVIGVAVFGQPSGATVGAGWIGAAFLAVFVAALPTFVSATRRAAEARSELDRLMAQVR